MQGINILFTAALLLASCSAFAQSKLFTKDGFEYTFELPSPTWRDVSNGDNDHRHAELVYGDRTDGYLRVRKELVEANTSLADVARRDQDTKLRFLPGFVEGKREPFAGRYGGLTASYEYTAGGKPMIGRVYYLQTDNRSVYTLHFTGLRERLQRIRNQTDVMARSFKVK